LDAIHCCVRLSHKLSYKVSDATNAPKLCSFYTPPSL
jgi:hypothetical protein